MRRIGRTSLLAAIIFVVCCAPGLSAATAGPQEKPVVFVNVNVVTMEQNVILQGQSVLIRTGRIEAIGPVSEVKVPREAFVIEGHERYLLPGLMDAHVHLVHESDLLLLLAHGVTTVRNMNGRPVHLVWQSEIEHGHRVGPRIVTAGPMLGEAGPYGQSAGRDRAVEPVGQQIRTQVSAGYDFIKLGDALPVSDLDGVFATASELGVTVVGHVPNGMQLSNFIAYGPRSIEHLDGLASLPDDQLHALADELSQNGVWVTPTLTIWQRFVPVHGEKSQAQVALTDYVERSGR